MGKAWLDSAKKGKEKVVESASPSHQQGVLEIHQPQYWALSGHPLFKYSIYYQIALNLLFMHSV